MRFPRPFILALAVSLGSIYAQGTLPDDGSSNHGVARLSVLTGDVSVRRNDSGEYVAAAVNAPVVAGDSIATGPSARTELQFDSANMLRVGHDSEIRLTDLQPGRIGLQIARGTLTYSVPRDSSTQVEIGTPTVSVRPLNRGTVRVSVLDDGQTEITVRTGQAEIYTPRGVETLGAGQTMLARGSASDPEFQIVAAIPRDAWDEWNDSRDRALMSSTSYQYVSQDISGAEDLDSYGQWVNDPSYGEVWSPRVSADWAPYRDGRWVSDDYYGWTWLGNEPWGWAPYHYGNWYRGSSGWCWYPGSRYSRSYWRPGVVGFFGFGGRSSSFGFGFGNVGWVPLAPFETYRPWYGRGRSFNIARNSNIYGSFRNARYNGLTGIDARNFSGGRAGGNFAVSRNHLSQAGIVQGGLPFRASGASQRFSDRQASFVPRGNSFSRQFLSRAGNRSTLFGSGSVQSSPGNRDSGWSRFGGTRGGTQATPLQNGRSSAGFQASPGNRDSGWSRFGGTRGGSQAAPIQNGRSFQSSPGSRDSGWSRFGNSRGGSQAAPLQNGRSFQSSPGNRDSGWSRFGSSRSGSQAAPLQNSRGSAGFQAPPSNRDWNRFNNSRGGSAPMPLQNGRGSQSAPYNRDFGSSRFGASRGGSAMMPQNGRGSAGLQSPPANRDFSGSRFGGNRGGSMPMPPSGRSGAYQQGFGSRGASPMPSAPRYQSPQAVDRSSGRQHFSGGGSPAVRSAPSPSSNAPSRGQSSAPASSGGDRSHRGRRDR